MNIDDFLSKKRSMVIAPAGYGKTHTIIESISANHDDKPILVLTHTNAGVASIREKAEESKLQTNKYAVITICGLEEQSVFNFIANQSKIPDKTDNQYYSIILSLAIKVATSAPYQLFIQTKYSHIIVDEFQDCSSEQLRFIQTVGLNMPIHILGDPMQSIYGFKHERMADMKGDECSLYHENVQYLETPWRWNNVGKEELGCELHEVRTKLESNIPIELSNLKICRFYQYAESDKYKKESDYWSFIKYVCNSKTNDKIIVITPRDEMIEYREKIVKTFFQLNLLDAVDAEGFYKSAKQLDECTQDNALQVVLDIFYEYAKNKSLDNYFNKQKKEFINSRDNEKKTRIDALRKIIDEAKRYDKKEYIKRLIDIFCNLGEMRLYHPNIIWDLQKAIRESIIDDSTIEEAMIKIHNIRRLLGRKIKTKSLATAQLTKGLEFDHVVILDAHLFKDKRYFYVAITRGCKSVTIVSEKTILSF